MELKLENVIEGEEVGIPPVFQSDKMTGKVEVPPLVLDWSSVIIHAPDGLFYHVDLKERKLRESFFIDGHHLKDVAIEDEDREKGHFFLVLSQRGTVIETNPERSFIRASSLSPDKGSTPFLILKSPRGYDRLLGVSYDMKLMETDELRSFFDLKRNLTQDLGEEYTKCNNDSSPRALSKFSGFDSDRGIALLVSRAERFQDNSFSDGLVMVYDENYNPVRQFEIGPNIGRMIYLGGHLFVPEAKTIKAFSTLLSDYRETRVEIPQEDGETILGMAGRGEQVMALTRKADKSARIRIYGMDG